MTMPLNARTQHLVWSDVRSNMTSIIATLAAGADDRIDDSGILNLADEAKKLAAPIKDYESAAKAADWWKSTNKPQAFVNSKGDYEHVADWKALCQKRGIAPEERDILEHWSVSDDLATMLIELGERVGRNFAGLNIWARTNGGHPMSLDPTLIRIAGEM